MKIVGPGTRIKFDRGDRTAQQDVVREVFWQDNVLPGGSKPALALVLTDHSWCWASEVTGVLADDSKPLTVLLTPDV